MASGCGTVPVGGTVTVLDLTGANYCCTSSPCPAVFTCDETYSFQVSTSAGALTAASQNAHIDLGGCAGEVCP